MMKNNIFKYLTKNKRTRDSHILYEFIIPDFQHSFVRYEFGVSYRVYTNINGNKKSPFEFGCKVYGTHFEYVILK